MIQQLLCSEVINVHHLSVFKIVIILVVAINLQCNVFFITAILKHLLK